MNADQPLVLLDQILNQLETDQGDLDRIIEKLHELRQMIEYPLHSPPVTIRQALENCLTKIDCAIKVNELTIAAKEFQNGVGILCREGYF